MRSKAKDSAARGIYKRGKFYWLAQQRNRKRVFVSLETEDFAIAVQRAQEIRDRPELNAGGLLEAEIARFIAYKIQKGDFVRDTADNSKNFLAHLPRIIGNLAPFQVGGPEVTLFYNTLRMRMTESSAQTYVAHARSFFRWCHKTARLCDKNPFDSLDLPKLISVAKKEFCLPELRDKLITECPRDDLRFVLYCGFHAGLRRKEICEARPSWFHVHGSLKPILHIKKISKEDATRTGLDFFDLKDREERSIPLSGEFTTFLKGWINPDADYVLGMGKRRRKNRYRFDLRRPFEDYMKSQGCPWVTFHTMRRTFGSIQASKGTSIYLIASWLGDDVETTTKHYAHLIPAHDTLEAGL